MARKLRVEYAGANYHVINRGNYRADIFADDATKEAFLGCLQEAAIKAGWRVHAYVLMSNHYHLALETPEGNLVEGMKWLQSTFSNRFNRFRGERGHVFQGRYKALLIEPEALGAVAHYIHLNPVRAGLVGVANLGDFPGGSYRWLTRPDVRPKRLEVNTFLSAAGGLQDQPQDWKRYEAYLQWLAADERAQRQLRFEEMTAGWALGGEAFKRQLAQKAESALGSAATGEHATREARALHWEAWLKALLSAVEQTEAAIATTAKACDWKVAIAARMKEATTVSNPWLSQRLKMGATAGISRYVTELRSGKRPAAHAIYAKISKSTV